MFDDVMHRIQETTDIRTQSALATCLGIKQSCISDAKRRDVIPDNWLVGLYENYNLNPTWLKTGRGAIYLTGDPDRAVPIHPVRSRPPQPTVTELKEALEARLGQGLRVVIVGAEDQVVTTPAGLGGAEGARGLEKGEALCNAI